MNAKNLLLAATAALALAPSSHAQTYLIRGARVVTVSGPVMPEASVLVRDGKIADIGPNLPAPAGAEVVEARGLSLYPGLFDLSSQIGMQGARENTMGELLPHLKAFWSYRCETDLADLARVNGVTHVMSKPGRGGPGGRLRFGLIPGQATVMNLIGATPEKAEITRDGPIMLNFPTVGVLEYTGDERFAVVPWSTTKKQYDKSLADLRRLFASANDYANRKGALAPDTARAWKPNLMLEAMIPVVQGRRAVLIDANSDVDIKAAVEFASALKLNYFIDGAEQAWKILDFLKENHVRLIFEATQAVPPGEDDPVDVIYRTPAMLQEKGIPFSLGASGGGGADTRHLGYQAGNAVAYGLSWDAALRAITLTPAEMLGLGSELGSIDKGKRANLVLAQGDIFEPSTRVVSVFIDGRPVSMETSQTRNYEIYRPRQ